MSAVLKLVQDDYKEENSDVVSKFLRKYRSKNTLVGYNTSIKEFFGIQDVTDRMIKYADYDDVQNYILELFDRGYKGTTIKYKVASLRSLFQYALDSKIITENPFADNRVKGVISVNITKGEVFTGRALSKEEVGQLLVAINNPLHKDMFTLMLRTGLRREETINFHTNDLIYRPIEDKYFIKILGKGERIRHVEVSTTLADMIKSYPEGNPYKMSLSYVNKLLSGYADKANIGEVAPHDMRRTFATLLIEQGYNINYLQHVLGHSNIQTTLKYIQNQNVFKQGLSEYIDW
jgi:integrase/recombinase XerD